MHSPRRLVLPILALLLIGSTQLSGCAGIPFQEMSNARQAVDAAKKAGAGQHAPELLAEAEQLLTSAKSNLNKGEYRAARDEADQAREKAMEARRAAEAATAPKPNS